MPVNSAGKAASLTKWCSASTLEANGTVAALDDDEETMPTLAEFKERYRRLIPFMTYYIAGNNVNSQTPAPGNYGKISQAKFMPQRTQYVLARPADSLKISKNYQPVSQSQEGKFIPSVQYDPKDIGSDKDYFTPVRYDSNLGFEDYSTDQLYRNYPKQTQIYPQVTTSASIQEDRYFTTARPLRPYDPTLLREYSPQKSISTLTNQDYLLDSVGRPDGKQYAFNNDYAYPIDDFESLRYVKPTEVPRVPTPFRLHKQPVQRKPPPTINLQRNPNINLNHVVKSLQLTNQLPEMLNVENIDSSIKTLVEILNLLHGARKTVLHPRVQIPAPPKTPAKFPNYVEYKSHYSRPKIITETRYQSTQIPIAIPGEPARYKPAPAYLADVKPQIPDRVNYNVDAVKNSKVVEYYTPHVQDIDDDDDDDEKNKYAAAVKPQAAVEDTTKHTYEITEDLRDDILEDERFTLPLTTEAPTYNYPMPDGVPSHTQNVPPTSLKYGATRGKPNVDYPAYSKIPETAFNCKDQRYKGFFGDPATGCQVWHYCDLNGGKSSFLCPNGTIFSQVALTCDWWFNVKCESTTQLYVLNERLYKYILPIMPKFPEDFTGPEVDRYLELKFKEMEAKMKEKKLKKQQEEKEKAKAKNKLQILKETE